MIENEAKFIITPSSPSAEEIFRICGWEYKYKRTRSIYFDTEDYALNANHISLRHKITADSLGGWYQALRSGGGKRHLTLKVESSHDKNNHHASRLEIEPKHEDK